MTSDMWEERITSWYAEHKGMRRYFVKIFFSNALIIYEEKTMEFITMKDIWFLWHEYPPPQPPITIPRPLKSVTRKCKWASFWTSVTEGFCVWILFKWKFVERIYSLKHDRNQWIAKEWKMKFIDRSCVTKLKCLKHHSVLSRKWWFWAYSDENWQFSIRIGVIIKFYAVIMIKKEENEQSQFPVNRK